MISNTREKEQKFQLWKLFKIIKSFLKPLLGVVVVVCGLLSCFNSAEGSHSRLICFILFVIACLLITGMTILDKYLEKKIVFYRVFSPKIIRKMQPEYLIPLFFMILIVLIPFYIILITSFKTPQEANFKDFSWVIKRGFTLDAYKELFKYSDITGISIGRSLWNSFLYAIIPTVIGVLVASISAYAFAKKQFKYKKAMYKLLLITMMMPGCVTMATSYIMFDTYGWVNTPLPLIIPGLFGAVSCVMFLREFFMGIPDGLLEAAEIDGANGFKQFFHIVLPLGKPALFAQFVLIFIVRYNDFLGPLIYLDDSEKYTIQIALSFLNSNSLNNSVIAAAGVLSLIPMLLLYMVFQKIILRGISMSSGLKG